MVPNNLINEIIFNISTTEFWCEEFFEIANIENSLRSDELNPKVDLWDLKAVDQGIVVKNLCEQRGKLARQSNKFLDQHGVPPWDTWIYFSQIDLENRYAENSEPCLFSWVPKEMISLVEKAISESSEDYYFWSEKIENYVENFRNQQDKVPPNTTRLDLFN